MFIFGEPHWWFGWDNEEQCRGHCRNGSESLKMGQSFVFSVSRQFFKFKLSDLIGISEIYHLWQFKKNQKLKSEKIRKEPNPWKFATVGRQSARVRLYKPAPKSPHWRSSNWVIELTCKSLYAFLMGLFLTKIIRFFYKYSKRIYSADL